MKQTIDNLWKEWFQAPFFSPRGFITRAVLIALFYVICHLLDWREHTTFLSGSTAFPDMSIKVSGTMGMIYIFAYLGFVLAVPILLLAAAILAFIERFLTSKRRV